MDRRQNAHHQGWFRRKLRTVAAASWICLTITGSALADPPPATGQSATAARDAINPELETRLQEWVVGLGSQEYSTRRRAFMELWKQGPIALPAVRRALTTSDQQTISAAKMLETLLSLDISPTDNDELAELMQLSGSNWEATLFSLGQKGYWRLATEVLRSNPELLNRVRESYPPNRFCPLIQTAFDQGNILQAWPTVAQGMAPDRRYYLTTLTREYLNKQYDGQLPNDMARLLNLVEDEAKLSTDDRALYLLYAGRAQEAWKLDPSPRVKQRIIYHAARWDWLKDPAVTAMTLGSVNDNLLRRARQAAYLGLAGDDAGSQDLASKLRPELLPTDASDAPKTFLAEIAKALVLCGEGQLVEDLVQSGGVTTDMEYYNYRFQYDKVFKKFGLDPTLNGFEEWLSELPGKLNPRGPQPMAGSNSFDSYMELTQFLSRNGFSEQSKQLFATLVDILRRSTPNEVADSWMTLGIRANDHQMRLLLLHYLDDHDEKLKIEERRMLLSQAYPDWQNTVEKLWQHVPAELSTVDGKSKRWRALERLWRYDRTLVETEAGSRVIETWLNTAQRESSKSEDATDLAVGELATVAFKLGLRRQALTMVRSEATRNIFADTAEMLTASGSFEAAGKWWESAVVQAPDNHMWIRRYADALLMQGEAELAASYESTIWLRPLGNRMPQAEDMSYSSVAEKYFDAGEYELAQQYGQAAVELAEQNERNWASRRLTQFAMELGNYEEAARASHIYAINLLMSGATIPRSRGDTLAMFIYYTSLQLMCSAAADIRAGRIEPAMANIAKYESILPSGIEVCEHVYPVLVKAGQQVEADRLLERCAARMIKHLEAWPKDSNSHNNLAWMLARCNARIPEAIEHAQKAVELSDRSPTYLDTLAEAEFCAGHIDRAIELTRECIAADPRHAHYQKQLQRFRGAIK